MAFEISEYLYFTSLILVAALLSQESGTLVVAFSLLLFVVSVYTLLLRKAQDVESARLYRILGSLLVIITSALAGSHALALLTLLWGMGALIISVSEHISHRGHVPVERA